MATSKLTRVLNDGFSKIRANVLPLSKESQPLAFISTASEISELISSLSRSDIESKSLPFKLTPFVPSVYHEKQPLSRAVNNQSFSLDKIGGIILVRHGETEWNIKEISN